MPPYDFSQDKALLERISTIQYAPYGLSPDQSTYMFASLGVETKVQKRLLGWDQIKSFSVLMRYASADDLTYIWLISHDPELWLTLEQWERSMYFASGIQHQSESLLYDALLPQLAKPDQEHVALADTLSGAVLALFSFPKAEAEVVYQFEYASRKISYMYDDKRPLPFIAVGLGFSEAQFKEVLASVVPINLQNPQTLALLLHQMSIQFQKRQADSR